MSGEQERLIAIKTIVDSVSPSFCLAKWTQVTLHLHNGRTHSCHHPRTHLVPLEELEKDPSALHNTNYKKQQRKMMKEGTRPPECQYCWNVEDLDGYKSGEFFSDRITKSGSDWSYTKLTETITKPWNENVNPTYVEVSFSNVCNFKCSYCSPVYSSKWVEEAKKHGPYPTTSNFNDLAHLKRTNELPIHHKEYNPYVEAFWKWWPDLYKDLQIFRITGGEPLLAKDTYKVLDWLIEKPAPELELAMNSNLGVPDSKLDTFISKMKDLTENDKVAKTHIFTSVDGHGKQAEYGRFGLDYDKWLKNVDRILTELPKTKITIMSTTNILSITSYRDMLKDVLELKLKHINSERLVPITVDVAILRHPHHQCVAILTDEYKDYMDECIHYMHANQEGYHGNEPYEGFFDFEVARMERFIEFMKAGPNENEHINVNHARADFYSFVNEHDVRRKTNFLKTFPELEDFYNECKSENDKLFGDI